MRAVLAIISSRQGNITGRSTELLKLYIDRSTRYILTEVRVFPDEARLLAFLEGSAARTRPFLLLTDSTGQQVTSEEIAETLTRAFDTGTQILVLGIGPANGWSPAARKRADQTIAFGRITLPHELAAVVAAEQIYRALTIRAGHPYHSGH